MTAQCLPSSLLWICFRQLVSSGLIISWIRSSNSQSPAAGQWTYCSVNSERDTDRVRLWFRRRIPTVSLNQFVFVTYHRNIWIPWPPLWNTVKQESVSVALLLQYVLCFRAIPSMLSPHLDADSSSDIRIWRSFLIHQSKGGKWFILYYRCYLSSARQCFSKDTLVSPQYEVTCGPA